MSIKEVVQEFLANTTEAVAPKPMKVGDKIRAALKLPEVQKRRAQLKAIGYLVNKGTVKYDVEWHTTHSQTDTCLAAWRYNADGTHKVDVEILHMPALSEYKISAT